MDSTEKMTILGLSKKEERVLGAVAAGQSTVLAISRYCGVSRPSVYDILSLLKKRELVTKKIIGGKKNWVVAKRSVIDRNLYRVKKSLYSISDGTEEVHGLVDSVVLVHRGAEAIRTVFKDLFTQHRNEKFSGLAGAHSTEYWNKIFSVKDTNAFNHAIKENHIIAETLLQRGWLEQQTNELGVEWAKEFEGRTARVNLIEAKDCAHGAQIFIFKKSLYLMALSEEVVIEVKNSEIQKMILAFFSFMQEHSRAIDANALLRDLIEKYTEPEASASSK